MASGCLALHTQGVASPTAALAAGGAFSQASPMAGRSPRGVEKVCVLRASGERLALLVPPLVLSTCAVATSDFLLFLHIHPHICTRVLTLVFLSERTLTPPYPFFCSSLPLPLFPSDSLTLSLCLS
jgi:hypothetical protein